MPKKKAGKIAKNTLAGINLPGVEMLEFERKNLTEELVKRYLGLRKLSWMKKRREDWIEYLVGEMKAGERFRYDHVVLASAVLDGKEYLLNGRHVLEALQKLGKKNLVPESVMTLKYKVKSLDDLRNLRVCFDQARRRTVSSI